MTDPAFDAAAADYDGDFTDTPVGRAQRSLVQRYLLERQLLGLEIKVLEINCGTGADAIWMAQEGTDVLATDLSGEMVALGQRKWQAHLALMSPTPVLGKVTFQQMDLRAASELTGPFDLVFSNFGGLNCVSPEEFTRFLHKLPSLIRPGGHFIGIIMPRFCIWESLYFMAKGRFKSAFRRSGAQPVAAPLGNGAFQDTWYHSPRFVRDAVAGFAKSVDTRPVGFYLPPSYLDPFFRKRPNFLQRLIRWEDRNFRKARGARWADHFLVAVEL